MMNAPIETEVAGQYSAREWQLSVQPRHTLNQELCLNAATTPDISSRNENGGANVNMTL
jgi:hypothetical protein